VESEGPEANDQAAAKADKAGRSGRRKPLGTRLRIPRRKGLPSDTRGESVVCAGGMVGQRAA